MQIYAFRKMREKLIMEENWANMYKRDKQEIKDIGDRKLTSMDEKEMADIV